MRTYSLEVWAPRAQAVQVEADGDLHPMSPDPARRGWWVSIEAFPPGTRYGFLLDGRGPFPDPRSRRQPDGIHGLSSLVDHADFAWTDAQWCPPDWKKAVVYELHIGTFTEAGTFTDAIEHLNHLVGLGISHVEILPCAGFPGARNWGYDCVSISAPNENYGGPEGLKRLIDACHARGLAVIIDVIYNHMGAEGNYVQEFGPYFTNKYPTPWGEGPNLDGEGSRNVRDFFLDNALMWLRDYHADGLRLDAIDKVTDQSPEHILVELRKAADQLAVETGIPRVLIAESAANDPIYARQLEDGGYGMDCQWTDDVHHAIHAFFSGERQNYYQDFGEFEHLVKALRQGFVYDGCYSAFRGKPHGKNPDGLSPSTFLVCLTNHDQIGNRPGGERIHHLPGIDPITHQIASALILLSPFTPMIFMGEEWGASTPFEFFSDHQDPEMATAVGKGRKEEFGGEMWDVQEIPDPQDEGCFLRSKLQWNERTEEGHCDVLNWYSQLIALRRQNAPFPTLGQVEASPTGDWLRMRSGGIEVVVALRDHALELEVEEGPVMVASAGSVKMVGNSRVHFEGKGVAVFQYRR